MCDCTCSLSFLPWAGLISALRPSVCTSCPQMDGWEKVTSHFCQHMMMEEHDWLMGSMKDGTVWSQTEENTFPMKKTHIFIQVCQDLLKVNILFLRLLLFTWLCLIGWMEFPHFTQNIRKMRQLLTPKLTYFLAYLRWANSFLSFINKC